MEETLFVILTTILLLGITARALVRAVMNPSPGGAVLITSMAYLIGVTIIALRDGNETTFLVFRICAVFIFVYLIGYFGAGKVLKLAMEMPMELAPMVDVGHQGHVAKWIAFLGTSGIVMLAIFITGTDRILAALYQFIFVGDSGVSVMGLRTGFASGEGGYMAPGYIKQFRDVLLPLFALLVVFSIRRTRRRFLLTIGCIVPLVATLMISSGERAPVLMFLIGTIYTALLSVRMGINERRTILAPILFIALVGGAAFSALTSSFTNRGYEDASTSMILADRVITRVPEENVLGVSVWEKGAPYPGAGWISELGSVLPWGKTQALSSQIHEELGGGPKGNSVLGMWVDVFYNFGWMLGVPVSLLLGVAMALFNHWVNLRRVHSPISAICGLWISVCMLMVLSPFGFLLYGPFIISGVLFLTGRATSMAIRAVGDIPAVTPDD
jgi:oligosaccharide repeat unit polymerase